MMAPLAYDVHGNAIELPPEAAYWRVRRHTGGRPSEICGSDGEPLFIPIGEDRPTLRANGCTGSVRLDAVDEERRAVDAPAAFVELGGDEAPARNSAALVGDTHADLLRVAIETNTRTMEAMQRAQIERERVLGIKEKALTDSQVAMMKMQSDLMIALGQVYAREPVARPLFTDVWPRPLRRRRSCAHRYADPAAAARRGQPARASVRGQRARQHRRRRS
jgi:hypothetical protein